MQRELGAYRDIYILRSLKVFRIQNGVDATPLAWPTKITHQRPAQLRKTHMRQNGPVARNFRSIDVCAVEGLGLRV